MKTELVKFYDSEILAVNVDDQWWIAIKPIAEAIGLNADSAVRGIKSDEILGQLYTDQYTVGADLKQRSMVCLPIEYIQGWLFGVETGKVRPDIKDRLIIFKKECYKALFDHFYGNTRSIRASIKRRYEISMELEEVKQEIHNLQMKQAALKAEYKRLEVDNFVQLNLFDGSTYKIDTPEELTSPQSSN